MSPRCRGSPPRPRLAARATTAAVATGSRPGVYGLTVGRIHTGVAGYLHAMDQYLGIYLNDQLAMGVVWRELARRSVANNRGTAAGEVLERVATGIAEDVETFRDIMRRLEIRVSRVKTGLAVVAERVGRVKPNGRLTSYSPLSRFEELEMLAMGIDGKKQLWATLRDLADLAERLPDVDFDGLIERAARQRAEVEPIRVVAGIEAFTRVGVARG